MIEEAGTKNTPGLASLARAARVVFLICYFSLLGLMVGESWLEDSIPVIWLVRLVPLLMFLPGVVRMNLRSHIWICTQ